MVAYYLNCGGWVIIEDVVDTRNLGVKILSYSSKVNYLCDRNILKIVCKGHFWEQESHKPIWPMIFLLLKLKFYF